MIIIIDNGIIYFLEVPSSLEKQKEREELDFISDREKLIILNQKLYTMAKSGEDTADLCQAIACLSRIINTDRQEQNSVMNQLSAASNSLILLGITFTFASYLLTNTSCKGSNSQFCKDARVIPTAIATYLADK